MFWNPYQSQTSVMWEYLNDEMFWKKYSTQNMGKLLTWKCSIRFSWNIFVMIHLLCFLFPFNYNKTPVILILLDGLPEFLSQWNTKLLFFTPCWTRNRTQRGNALQLNRRNVIFTNQPGWFSPFRPPERPPIWIKPFFRLELVPCAHLTE